jgi:hypothetical protein
MNNIKQEILRVLNARAKVLEGVARPRTDLKIVGGNMKKKSAAGGKRRKRK